MVSEKTMQSNETLATSTGSPRLSSWAGFSPVGLVAFNSMKTIKFSEALRQLTRSGDAEVIATQKARKACFKAGLTRESNSITVRLFAVMSSKLNANIIAG